jgi:hypothetical protein
MTSCRRNAGGNPAFGPGTAAWNGYHNRSNGNIHDNGTEHHCHARGKADIHVAGQARDAHKHGNPPQHDGVHVKSR